MRILERLSFIKKTTFSSSNHSLLPGSGNAPFISSNQRRWKKPADTARTRLDNRIRDLALDKLTARWRRLSLILEIHCLVSSRKRGCFISLQSLSKWASHAGLTTISAGSLVRKYPHIFEVFTHPVKRNLCCKFTHKFTALLEEECDLISQLEHENVMRIKKILLMSVNGSVHVHALRLLRIELGLPENFRDTIICKYGNVFRLVDLEVVELVDRDDESSLNVAEIEKWRENEYTEKWLSEFEVKYAFPMNFPTGFKIEPGFREKLRNWQRVAYVKPYERMNAVRVRTCGGVERYEKRAVGIIHELLCLTVEKMIPLERLAHFRKDLGIEVNIRELLLQHPGIFYVSIRGNTQLVFLRGAYTKGSLLEPNLIYDVRRKLQDLILLGCRNTRALKVQKEDKDDGNYLRQNESDRATQDCDFVIPILEKLGHRYHQENLKTVDNPLEEELNAHSEEEISQKSED